MLDRRQPIGHSLLNGLVGYWPLDDSRNSNANTTWRELHAGLVLSPGTNNLQDAAGIGQHASQFNAASARFVKRASEAALQIGTSDATVAAWVYLDSKPASAPSIVTKYEATVQTEFILWYNTTADRFQWYCAGGASATSQTNVLANTFGAISLATWYFVVGTHDSVNDLIGISVNAGTQDTAAHSANVYVGTADFRIGNWQHTADRCWDGRIQNVGFWKRLLSAEERTYLYNGGIGRRYPFV